MKETISGRYVEWSLLGHKRVYADVTMTFAQVEAFVQPVRFNALVGKGQQRAVVDKHVKDLLKAKKEGTFTPTQISAALNKKHQEALVKSDGSFSLEVDSGDPLLQVDGQHRVVTVGEILKELREQLKACGDTKSRDKVQEQIDEVLALPFGVRIYFDGTPEKDFVALQAGLGVDKTHILSMKIKQKAFGGKPEFSLAFEAGKALNKSDGVFKDLIRFDSKGDAKGAVLRKLPLNTLYASGASDVSFSLIGLARVALHFKADFKDKDFLANCVNWAFAAVAEREPDLVDANMPLGSPLKGGSKGAATMIVGVGTILAYRLLSLGKTQPDEADLTMLARCAKKAFGDEIEGNFGGPVKRKLMGDFAEAYLADLEEEKHDSLPIGLLRALSSSSLNAAKLPAQLKTEAAQEQQPVSEATPAKGKKKGGKATKPKANKEALSQAMANLAEDDPEAARDILERSKDVDAEVDENVPALQA